MSKAVGRADEITNKSQTACDGVPPRTAIAQSIAAPEPVAFAGKAKDLRDAVVDAATLGGGLWLSYFFMFFYLAIAAGGVTHRDLFFENPVKLPFLNVDLPLVGFFVLGPLLFLIVHAYTLLHFTLLAGKVGAFDTALREHIADDDTRAHIRQLLPSNIFVQFQADYMYGWGLFSGVGLGVGGGATNQAIPNGISTSSSWHSEVNAGWIVAGGGSLDIAEGSVSGSVSPDPRIGAGYGIMAGTGPATITTIAIPLPPIALEDFEAYEASEYVQAHGLQCLAPAPGWMR
jgi:hypothetical protein